MPGSHEPLARRTPFAVGAVAAISLTTIAGLALCPIMHRMDSAQRDTEAKLRPHFAPTLGTFREPPAAVVGPEPSEGTRADV